MLFKYIIIAIIEGITEFLPISSTGHMIIGSAILGITPDEFSKFFMVCIQLGAILAVVILYWKRFFQSMDFYFKLIVAFIPAVIFGVLFNDTIDEMLESVLTVSISMFIGGIILLFIDRVFKKSEENKTKNVSYLNSIIIGMFQVISMIPGVSRSAATIIGGLTQKLNRKQAAEFSFLLAVPTMAAATLKKVYDFYKDWHQSNPDVSIKLMFNKDQVLYLFVGNIVAFIVAYFVIKGFISYLNKYGFKAFGVYRIIVGSVLIILLLLKVPLNII